MRLISDNSEEDIKRRRAEADLRRILRGMAANFLRVVRGAGRPHQLGADLRECLSGFEAYREVFGSYPSSDLLQKILSPESVESYYIREREERLSSWATENPEEAERHFIREDAKREIWRAGLQVAASMLADQKIQIRQGESDLSDAIRLFNKSYEFRRAPRAEVAPISLPPTKKSSTTPSPKPEIEKSQRPAALPPDPFEPPDYSGLRSAPLPQHIIDEFGQSSTCALVDRLNALWRQQGRRPLPQGSYPSNANQLNFVVKELRLAEAVDAATRPIG